MIKDLNDLGGPSKCNYMYPYKRETEGNLYVGRREGSPIPEAGTNHGRLEGRRHQKLQEARKASSPGSFHRDTRPHTLIPAQ